MSSVLTLACAIVLLQVPGLLLGWCGGLRGRLLWGVAPALTLGLTGVLALVYAKGGIVWSPMSALGGVLVTSIVVWVIAWALRRRFPIWFPAEPVRTGRWTVNAAIAVAAVIAVAIMWAGTDGLTLIPQGWDTTFHGSVIRFIATTGDASPFSLADIAAPADPAYYYPDAFHALAALLLQLPGQGMPVVLNAVITATAVVYIPAVVALVQRIDARTVSMSAAAVLAVSFTGFPVLQAAHGPLSPFALALAATPGLLAALLALLRRPGVPAVGAVALGFSGVYVTHPSIAAAALIAAAAIGVGWLLWGGRTRDRRRVLALVVAGVGAVALTYPSVDTGASGVMSTFDWPATHTVPQALADLVGFEAIPGYAPPQWMLTALALLGLYALRRRRELRPLVAAAVVFGYLFAIAAVSDAPYVQTLTSLWWNDKFRFMAIYTVLMVPVTTCGVVVLAELLSRVAKGRVSTRTAGFTVVVVIAVVAAAVYAPRGARLLEKNYTDGPNVYDSEVDLYRDFARLYDEGAIMNDPFDGSPWLFTLEQVPVLIPNALGGDPVAEQGPDRMALYGAIDRYGNDPHVDEVIDRLDVRWVLVGEGSMGGREPAPGFAGLADNPRFVEVLRSGEAVVYRVLR